MSLSKERLEKELMLAKAIVEGLEKGLSDEARPAIKEMEESLAIHRIVVKGFEKELTEL